MPVHDFNFYQASDQERVNQVDKSVAPPAIEPEEKYLPGRGIDIGTANLVASLQREDSSLYRSQRNSFINLEKSEFSESLLSKMKMRYFPHQGELYVLGDAAFEIANFVDRDVRRPMKDGLLSSSEAEALPIIERLIGQVVGRPSEPGEIVYIGIPAEPIDLQANVIYHREICIKMLSNLGYTPETMEEGQAIVFAELGADDFTGVGVSCGAGMFNVSVSYKSMPCLTFSTSRAGDWIDENAATAMDRKPTKMAALKEHGVNLLDPQSREEEAIAIYYRYSIKHALQNIVDRFPAEDMPSFGDPVDMVCAGGTSAARGFTEIFREELEQVEFPIPIKGVRLASDPLNATARGLLIAARSRST